MTKQQLLELVAACGIGITVAIGSLISQVNHPAPVNVNVTKIPPSASQPNDQHDGHGEPWLLSQGEAEGVLNNRAGF